VSFVHARVCLRTCLFVCVRACVRACVCVCVRACGATPIHTAKRARWLPSDWRPEESFYSMNEVILDRGSEVSLNRLGVVIDGAEVSGHCAVCVRACVRVCVCVCVRV
jgi:hypothetical protein